MNEMMNWDAANGFNYLGFFESIIFGIAGVYTVVVFFWAAAGLAEPTCGHHHHHHNNTRSVEPIRVALHSVCPLCENT